MDGLDLEPAARVEGTGEQLTGKRHGVGPGVGVDRSEIASEGIVSGRDPAGQAFEEARLHFGRARLREGQRQDPLGRRAAEQQT